MGYGDLDRFINKNRIIINCTKESDCSNSPCNDVYMTTCDISVINDDNYLDIDFLNINIFNDKNSIILMSEYICLEPGEIYFLYKYNEDIDDVPVFLIFGETDFFKQLDDFYNVEQSVQNNYFTLRNGIKRISSDLSYYFCKEDDDFINIENINK